MVNHPTHKKGDINRRKKRMNGYGQIARNNRGYSRTHSFFCQAFQRCLKRSIWRGV